MVGGGEEGERLHQEGILFEVIPGISSAIAAPAYAGIPVTHREYASMVSLITGHEDPTKPETQLDWPAIAKIPGTLVFLMGIKQLPHIVEQLLRYGKSPETPVALIHWGTRPEQKTLTGTLSDIVEALKAYPLSPPCSIVVGDVVQLRPQLNWFETLPLFGKTIVITRARKQASELRGQLEGLGARVIEFPTIAIQPPHNPQEIRAELKSLLTYDWVIFTSPNGVEYTMKSLLDASLDARAFSGVKIAAIGPATAQALEHYGLVADLIPPQFVAESIFEALQTVEPDLSQKRFLLPRADIAREMLTVALETAGAYVKQLPVYQTVLSIEGADIESLKAQLQAHTIDAITFSSSSTVTNFAQRLSALLHEDPHLLDGVTLASIGPITSNTLLEQFGRVDLEATSYTIPGLVRCLTGHFLEDKHPMVSP